MKSIIDLIIKAREEAIVRGIAANSLVIGEKLRYVTPFNLIDAFPDGNRAIAQFKPMIVGLEIEVKELPENIDFIVYKADETFNERLKDQIHKDTAKDVLVKCLNLCHEQGGVCYDVDIQRLAADYGVEVDE